MGTPPLQFIMSLTKQLNQEIGSFTITGPTFLQTFTVTQEGVPAYLNTSSSTLSIGYQEGSAALVITSDSGIHNSQHG